MNTGKLFEQDFQKSLRKDGMFYLRLIDAGGWSNADNTRFTPKNLCDMVIHYQGYTILAELKSNQSKSISNLGQLGKMCEIDFDHVLPVFILNFRGIEETYILDAYQAAACLEHRKSVDVGFCRKHGTLIECKKNRTRYLYDIEKSFKLFIK